MKTEYDRVGLGTTEALRLYQLHGPNELTSEGRHTFIHNILHVMREPMLFFLLACAVIYLFLGDLVEGLLLCFSALFMILINLYQYTKTERALQSLKEMASPRVLVIREGKEIRISGREVVPGDLMVLSEGDRISADAKLIESSHFMVDESLLTGESLPVRKLVDDTGQLFSGTLVVKGRGMAVVTGTGLHTEIGKIGKSLSSSDNKGTKLQAEVLGLGKVLFVFSIIFCVLVIVAYKMRSGSWGDSLLAGLASSLSMLPEELPVILTLFFAMGAWRISKEKVLTRRVGAIENLGATTVLCVDKTGTLTKNEMALRKLIVEEEIIDLKELEALPEKFHTLVEFAVLSSHRDPFDPMEKAILAALDKKVVEQEHRHPTWNLLKEYPLTNELLAMCCVWDDPATQEHVIAAKGAPEAIFDLCHLSTEKREALEQQVRALASSGLRVLAVAKAVYPEKDKLPSSSHVFDFTWLGILGLEDPLREEVPSALKECRTAGIRVLMMTGDYPETAKKIAEEAGFPPEGEVVTGVQLQAMDANTLKSRIHKISVFARMSHDQKLRIVQALKDANEVVAMTGDGVNDAPSLKNADIGIAMGKRGTDVAREASDIVLMQDDFQSIVNAVRLGRRIYDNIRNATAYVLALHIPIAGMTLIPAFLGWPLILSPIHLVLLELLIDPSCSLALEGIPADRDIMNRPPRQRNEVLFQTRFILVSAARGLVPLILGIAVIYYSNLQGFAPGFVRGISFLILLGNIVGLILVAVPKSQLKEINWALVVVLLFVFVTIPLLYYIPALRHVLSFDILSPVQILYSFGLGMVPTWIFGKLFSVKATSLTKT